MKILVTGGAGFIGSHMVEAYIKEGYEVVVIDNFVSGKKEYVSQKATLVAGDITDSKLVAETFEKYGPFDVINHMAAQKSVTDSVKNPVFDAQTNIIGSLTIFEAARKNNVKQIIFSSTGGALYGEGTDLPLSEDAAILPMSPYGIAKYSVEHYLRFYQIYGIKTQILRYSNVYGPRQNPYGEAGVVAIFCMKIQAKEPIVIYGDGTQTRDFVFVKDVVAANLAAQKLGESGVWNIGTSQEISVNQVAQELNTIAQENNLAKQAIEYEKPRLGEILRNAIAISKAKKELNWQPKYNLKEGLEKTLESFA